MKKVYTVKPTPKQMKEIKRHYNLFKKIESVYYAEMVKIEAQLEKVTGIEGLEFFFYDGELAGIGNRARTMKLIHRKDLEK